MDFIAASAAFFIICLFPSDCKGKIRLPSDWACHHAWIGRTAGRFPSDSSKTRPRFAAAGLLLSLRSIRAAHDGWALPFCHAANRPGRSAASPRFLLVTLRSGQDVRSLSRPLGLVCGRLCRPALALAPVQAPSLPASPRFSLSRSRWAGLTARLPSDSAWSPGRCAALRSASLRSIRACQPALALLFYTQFALLELLPWSW